MRGLFKTLKISLIVIIILSSLTVILTQTAFVQTRVAEYVSEHIFSKLDAEVSFSKINFRPFNTLVIKDLCIKDNNPAQDSLDVLMNAEYLLATFNLNGLTQVKNGKGVHLKKVIVRNGLFNLVLEKGKTTNLQRMFGLKAKDDNRKKKNDRDIFSIDKVNLRNFAYHMPNVRDKSPKKQKTRSQKNNADRVRETGIDWDDLQVDSINIKAHELKFSQGVMSGRLEHLDFIEKSGFRCSHLSGKAAVGNGKCIVDELVIQDGVSDIHMPQYTMTYASSKSFRDYVNLVSMGAVFNETKLNTSTLKYFAPVFAQSNVDVILNGTLNGPVNNMNLDHLHIRTDRNDARIGLSGNVLDLTTPQNTRFDIRLHECKSNVKGVEKLIRSMGFENFRIKRELPEDYADIKGDISGCIDDIYADLGVDSRLGVLHGNMNISDLTNGTPVIEGSIQAQEVMLGSIMGKEILGNCSLRTAICAELDRENGPSLRIDSLMIDKIGIKGHDYSRIAAIGTLSQKLFEGRIISQDPVCNFLFHGIFSLTPKNKNAVYQFYANIGHADLHKMNIDRRENSNISLRMNANFNRTPQGHMLGNINVGNIKLECERQKYDIGDISIASNSIASGNANRRYRINFDSSFAEARYLGNKDIESFMQELIALTINRELPALSGKQSTEDNSGNYDLSLNFIDPSSVCAFFKPGFYIDPNTELKLSMNSEGLVNGKLRSRRIAFKEQYIKDMDLDLSNANDFIGGELKCSKINVASLPFENGNARIYINNNQLGLSLSYENEGNTLNKGEFISRGILQRNANNELTLDASILPSGFYINSNEWSITPANIYFDKRNINISGLELLNGDQSISVEGTLSKEKADTLKIGLDRFDASAINNFLKKGALNIRGAVTGEALVTSNSENRKGILANFLVDSCSVAGSEFGNVYASSLWNTQFNRFDISLSNRLNGYSSVSAKGHYYPTGKLMEAEADLSNMDIRFFRLILGDVFSQIEGGISGKIIAEGSPGNLSISSRGTRFNKSRLTVGYTMVPYEVDGEFDIDSYGINFNEIQLKDSRRGTGVLNGRVNWDRFRDINIDLHIDADNIEAINRPLADNDGYYGQIFGTGYVDISGPLKDISIDVDMMTSDQGRFYIPLNNNAVAGKTDLLQFREKISVTETDPYEEMMSQLRKKEKEQSKNNLGVNINVHVNPLVEGFLEINRDNGSIVTGRGSGDINVDFRTGRPLAIKGDYTLDEGNFHLNLMNLASRDFTINNGSFVKFNGGIMESDLDIDAIYKTKAPISALIGDTTSVNSRRNIDCMLNLSGKLKEPKVGFSIDIPDLEPSVKARVENALSTEDKVQRQMLALLLTNSFLSDEQSGISNSTASSAIYSNAMGLISNQLNNILTKLNIPLDLGLKYQQNERGNDVFDVAVSTQLFNNRVIINGNIGNRQYKNGNSNSEVAGDIDMEVKIDRSGSLRLNIFSHSADQYSNYLDNTQRSGAGIAYQREFNKVSEVFRYMFAGKKKKEKLDMEEQKRLQEEGMKTIVIE